MPWTIIPRIYIGTDQTLFDPAQSSIYADLDGYLSRQEIRKLPYTSTQTLVLAGTNYSLIDSTHVSENLSVFPGSTYKGGVVTTLLPGSVGAASLNTATDSLGAIINKIDIRDATTNDPILDAGGNVVYGLIQSSSTTLDGDAIGPSGSENTQLSFFSVDPTTDTLQLVSLTGTIEFQLNKVYDLYNTPSQLVLNESPVTEIIARPLFQYVSLLATSDYVAGETINIQTGAGLIAGTSIVEGDSISIPFPSTPFVVSNEVEVRRNGKLLEHRAISTQEIVVVSANQIQLDEVFLTGDTLTIKVPVIY